MTVLLAIALLLALWSRHVGMKESWQRGFKEGFEKGLQQKVATLERVESNEQA
jgi:hypothetical protein